MIETCDKCSEYSTCTKLCDKLKEHIPKEYEWTKEIPVSNFIDQTGKESENEKDLTIDNFRNIDLGRAFDDTDDTEIKWDNTVESSEVDFDSDDRNALEKSISKAIPFNEKKKSRRFHEYLRCTKMSIIAKRAGVTKQNIQRQFQKIINRIQTNMSDGKSRNHMTVTPLAFKMKIMQFKDF